MELLNQACQEDAESYLHGVTFDGDFTDNLFQIDFASKKSFSARYDNFAWRSVYFERTKEEVQSLISIMAAKKE